MKKRICEKIETPVLPSVEDEALAQLAQALGHPARVAIVRLLQERQTCLCGDIVEVLPLAQSTVSQHLKVLKESGLIHDEVDGPRVCYCINYETLTRFQKMVGEL